jgi:hypothetical protein
MTKNLSPEEYLTDCLLCDGIDYRNQEQKNLGKAAKYIASGLVEDILDYSIKR